MEQSYAIRLAGAADIETLAAIERAASKLFPVGRIPDTDHTLPIEELETAFAASLLWVADCDYQVVGFACCEQWAASVHLAELAVHPTYGKRGIGRALVTRVIEQASIQGKQSVTLTTFRDLPFNGPFYADMGFKYLDQLELSSQLNQILQAEAEMDMTNRVAMKFTHD